VSAARSIPYSELYDAAVSGRVSDAPLVVAVLVAHAQGLVGR
jgi:ADP-ribose pyrophosphatase